MLFLVSPGPLPPLPPLSDPPGRPPNSEPAIVTTPLHQPTPPHTGMSLVAVIKCPHVPIPMHVSAPGCRHGTFYEI